MYGYIKLSKVNSGTVGSFFALTLLIPQNIGINLFGINLEDIPLIFIFTILLISNLLSEESNYFIDIFFSGELALANFCFSILPAKKASLPAFTP